MLQISGIGIVYNPYTICLSSTYEPSSTLHPVKIYIECFKMVKSNNYCNLTLAQLVQTYVWQDKYSVGEGHETHYGSNIVSAGKRYTGTGNWKYWKCPRTGSLGFIFFSFRYTGPHLSVLARSYAVWWDDQGALSVYREKKLKHWLRHWQGFPKHLDRNFPLGNKRVPSCKKKYS